MEVYNGDIALITLTVGDLLKILDQHYNLNVGSYNSADTPPPPHGRLVYGLRGIQDLFGCSHKQAHYYKEHVIQEAVSQNGRKIVVDADLALKLFNQRRNKK